MTSIDFVIMLFLLTLNKHLFVVLLHYSNLLQYLRNFVIFSNNTIIASANIFSLSFIGLFSLELRLLEKGRTQEIASKLRQ